MKILDKISYSLIIPAAILLSLAPLNPEPHLIEKLRMLSTLSLTKPIDIFDLVLHSAPLIILILKLIRSFLLKSKAS